MNGNKARIREKMVLVHMKVLSMHSPAGIKKYHENISDDQQLG